MVHKRMFNMVLRASAIHAKVLQKRFQGSKANCRKSAMRDWVLQEAVKRRCKSAVQMMRY